MMGWPMEDYEQLMWWNNCFFMGTSKLVGARLDPSDLDADGRPTQETANRLMLETAVAVQDYLREQFAKRRDEPRDDIMSQLMELEYEGQRPLTEDELVRIGLVMFLGGLDTVANTLSLILWDFARNPEHRRAFVAIMEDEEKVGPAINELMRWNAITSLPKRVSRDVEFRGLRLKEGDIVNLDTCTASRDPNYFAHADELDFERRPNAHFGFGHGRHRCLGIHLARRELKVALQELHRRMPDYEIKPGSQPRTKTQLTRGLENLDLVAV
jgi:cytochrome P450